MSEKTLSKENNKRVEQVQVYSTIGNAAPALTFIFTMLTMCFWGIYAGIYTGPTALAVGIVQLACFVPYSIGAIICYMRDDSMNGNIFLIFAALFGSIGGLTNIALGLSEILGFEMNNQMTAIPNIWGAISLIPLLISYRKVLSATTFLCFSVVVCFLTLMSLVSLNIIPPTALVNTTITWFCFFVAVSGLYTFFNAMLAIGGSKPLPEGKPLFK